MFWQCPNCKLYFNRHLTGCPRHPEEIRRVNGEAFDRMMEQKAQQRRIVTARLSEMIGVRPLPFTSSNRVLTTHKPVGSGEIDVPLNLLSVPLYDDAGYKAANNEEPHPTTPSPESDQPSAYPGYNSACEADNGNSGSSSSNSSCTDSDSSSSD